MAVQADLVALGPARAGEKRVVMVFGLAILGWLAPSLIRLIAGEGSGERFAFNVGEAIGCWDRQHRPP